LWADEMVGRTVASMVGRRVSTKAEKTVDQMVVLTVVY